MTTTTAPSTQTESTGKYSLSHLMTNLEAFVGNLVALEASLKELSGEATMALAMIDVGQVMSGASNYGDEVGAVNSLTGEGGSNPAYAPAGAYVNEANSELDGGNETNKKSQSQDFSLAHATGEQCESQGKSMLNALKSEESSLNTIFKDLTQVAKNVSSDQSSS